ncbi:hypothetical protein [Wolbachia endosymbiont of Ctenocephalides felis wCfeJ]|uniref:hypothetical protein n=1 Tax=Wolbachia endosymbiont of Ctenocephalides felis wCfeJ TaxID=2732594 RepID=UPI0014480349|nr:hypothetical protein [Wolbachia endosymbiont of Ctenocephalides felis wCfeJ]
MSLQLVIPAPHAGISIFLRPKPSLVPSVTHWDPFFFSLDSSVTRWNNRAVDVI